MKLALIFVFALYAPAFAQNECQSLQNLPSLNASDNIGIVHKNACWDPVGLHISFPLLINPAIFNIKNYGCVADDVTDNSTCFTNASAAVNAYSGPGIPVLDCTMAAGDIAFKTNSAGLVFNIPARLEGNCTIDAGVGVTGPVVQIGPTGLVAFSNAQAKTYSVIGITFVGGTGGATAVTVEPFIPHFMMTQTVCINFGTSAITSWCLLASPPNPEIHVINNFCIINDSTTGRNCYKSYDNTGHGSNTTQFVGNTIWSATAPAYTSPCSGTGIWSGGGGSDIISNSIFGFTNPIRISSGGVRVYGGLLDNNTNGCTSNGNFAILLGAPAQTATFSGIDARDIFVSSPSGHMTGQAVDATAITLTNSHVEDQIIASSQSYIDYIVTLPTGFKYRLNNGTGTELLDITSGGIWTVFSGSTVNNFSLVGSTAFATPLVETTTVTRAAPVKADTSNANQVVFTTTTDTAAGIVIGVLGNAGGVTAGTTANIVTTGVVALTLGTGTCSIGNFVIVDTTTNSEVKCTGTYTAGTVIGVALQADAVIGTTFNTLVGLR